jgi:hypothetical protein
MENRHTSSMNASIDSIEQQLTTTELKKTDPIKFFNSVLSRTFLPTKSHINSPDYHDLRLH